jgi:protein tyrosine/serine phosphatase
MKKQIELLKKYGVSIYTIEGNKITTNGSLYLGSLQNTDKDFLKGTTINGSLDLSSLQNADKDFLKGTTINGSLHLRGLQNADKDFLKGTTINGFLDLRSLQNADKDFLKGTTINGSLYLSSLQNADKDFLKGTPINGSLDLSSLQNADKDFLKGTTINGFLYLGSLQNTDKDFLKGTTINGSLDLSSLQNADKDFLKGTTINGILYLGSLQNADKVRSNPKQLKEGYDAKRGYCFYDGVLSKVKSVKDVKGYTVFTLAYGFLVKKGKYTAHGNTVKKSIQDLEFKIVSEKLKKSPIKKDTVITIQYYRLITGACELGVKQWMSNNKMIKESYKASELLPILEKTNAYGLDKFKSLITF